MLELRVILKGDGCWPDLDGRADLVWVAGRRSGEAMTVAMLPGGTRSGKPSVAVRIDYLGGVVVAETSLTLFLAVADALRGATEPEGAAARLSLIAAAPRRYGEDIVALEFTQPTKMLILGRAEAEGLVGMLRTVLDAQD